MLQIGHCSSNSPSAEPDQFNNIIFNFHFFIYLSIEIDKYWQTIDIIIDKLQTASNVECKVFTSMAFILY